MEISNQEQFQRFLDEMNGDSNDIPLRPVLESKSRYILDSFDSNDVDEILDGLSEDITLVLDTKSPGEIIKGKQELISYFEAQHAQHTWIKTIPIITIVDSGRITCYSKQCFCEDGLGLMSTMLIIYDLNASQLIQRMEYRKIEKDSKFWGSDGDLLMSKAKEETISVKYDI
ncbi:Putative NTF2-like domain superfamily protein [Colletotrichum destructivum]|uniref:NTF2-like domain superfamily protein n=1 Tax=Colletotrichum destructivum TaxID=34406 RepID=A0AAX4IMH2_9PEZI|nr:Putative NTF2-like domain superfamily protein [Colletotrichum destructivum]